MDRLLSLQSTSLEHERRLGCVERSASSIVSGMAALTSSSSLLDRLECRVELVDRSAAAAVAGCLRETEQLRDAQRTLDESVRGAWSATCSIREELASDDIRAEGLDMRLVSLERDPRPGDTAARVSAIEDDNRAIAQEQSTLAIEVARLANSCADVAHRQTVGFASFQEQLDRCAPALVFSATHVSSRDSPASDAEAAVCRPAAPPASAGRVGQASLPAGASAPADQGTLHSPSVAAAGLEGESTDKCDSSAPRYTPGLVSARLGDGGSRAWGSSSSPGRAYEFNGTIVAGAGKLVVPTTLSAESALGGALNQAHGAHGGGVCRAYGSTDTPPPASTVARSHSIGEGIKGKADAAAFRGGDPRRQRGSAVSSAKRERGPGEPRAKRGGPSKGCVDPKAFQLLLACRPTDDDDDDVDLMGAAVAPPRSADVCSASPGSSPGADTPKRSRISPSFANAADVLESSEWSTLPDVPGCPVARARVARLLKLAFSSPAHSAAAARLSRCDHDFSAAALRVLCLAVQSPPVEVEVDLQRLWQFAAGGSEPARLLLDFCIQASALGPDQDPDAARAQSLALWCLHSHAVDSPLSMRGSRAPLPSMPLVTSSASAPVEPPVDSLAAYKRPASPALPPPSSPPALTLLSPTPCPWSVSLNSHGLYSAVPLGGIGAGRSPVVTFSLAGGYRRSPLGVAGAATDSPSTPPLDDIAIQLAFREFNGLQTARDLAQHLLAAFDALAADVPSVRETLACLEDAVVFASSHINTYIYGPLSPASAPSPAPRSDMSLARCLEQLRCDTLLLHGIDLPRFHRAALKDAGDYMATRLAVTSSAADDVYADVATLAGHCPPWHDLRLLCDMALRTWNTARMRAADDAARLEALFASSDDDDDSGPDDGGKGAGGGGNDGGGPVNSAASSLPSAGAAGGGLDTSPPGPYGGAPFTSVLLLSHSLEPGSRLALRARRDGGVELEAAQITGVMFEEQGERSGGLGAYGEHTEVDPAEREIDGGAGGEETEEAKEGARPRESIEGAPAGRRNAGHASWYWTADEPGANRDGAAVSIGAAKRHDKSPRMARVNLTAPGGRGRKEKHRPGRRSVEGSGSDDEIPPLVSCSSSSDEDSEPGQNEPDLRAQAGAPSEVN